WGANRIEVSGFHGELDQNATQINLPIQSPDSIAVRYTREFDPQYSAMLSYATLPGQGWISGSFYGYWPLRSSLQLWNTFIVGGRIFYDGTPALISFGDEVLVQMKSRQFWARLEVLQRTPMELQIPGLANPLGGQFIGSLSLGFNQSLF